MIWISIFSILFVFMTIISKGILGSLKNPISVFGLLWCLIGIGANVAFYDYYKPSTIVNYMIVIGCIGSFIVYGLSMHGYNKYFFIDEIQIEDEYVNIRRVVIANLIGIVILLPYAIRSLNMITSGGFAYLRSEGVFNGGFYAILNDSIIRPLFTAITIVAIVYSFSCSKTKEKILLLVISIIANVEQVVLSAGRAPLVNFVFYLIIAIILFYGRSIGNILYKGRKYIFLGAIAAVAVLKITSQRNMSQNENLFLYNTYVYYFSGPAYLSQLIENVTQYGPEGTLLYGAGSFGFITNIWADIMIFFTGKAQGSLYLLGSVISNNQYRVGAHTLINAMYTCFYPFYIDYGWLGIIVCPIFIGIASAIFTKRLYKNKNIFNISIYIYWMYVIIRTVFKWDLVNIDLVVVLVSIHFFTKHKFQRV